MFVISANCPSIDHKTDAAKPTVHEARVVLGKNHLVMVVRAHIAFCNFDDHYLIPNHTPRQFKKEIECFEGYEPNRRYHQTCNY